MGSALVGRIRPIRNLDLPLPGGRTKRRGDPPNGLTRPHQGLDWKLVNLGSGYRAHAFKTTPFCVAAFAANRRFTYMARAARARSEAPPPRRPPQRSQGSPILIIFLVFF